MTNRAIQSLPKLYRRDTLINKLYDSGYVVYNKEDKLNTANHNNIFFKTLNEYGCLNYEYDLGLAPLTTLSDRRNAIESKWKAWSKCSLQSLQNLATFNSNSNRSYSSTYNCCHSSNSRNASTVPVLVWVYIVLYQLNYVF